MSEAEKRPGAMPGFAELVDVAALQALMDSFHQVIGIANAIIDLDGVVITQSGWQDLCIRYHRINPQTCRRCVESDTSLALSMTRGEHFASYRCLNGLVDTASPVIVDGHHVANIFTGQFFTAPPDLEFFRAQAGRFGFDEAGYLAAVAKVPVISGQRAEAVVQVYAQFAQLLAANGLDRLRQRRAEEALRAANAGLEQRSRDLEAANKELEEFSYSVSHDLRAPLRAMAGYSQILMDEHGRSLDDEARRLLTAVGDNAVHMGELIDGILDFLHLGRQRLSRSAVAAGPLAEAVFADLAAAEPSRRLRCRVAALPPAWGDAAMIRRLFANLLANAVKFTRCRDEALIEVGGTAGEEENTYFVRDNGVGFDMRFGDKLFKVFERLHPRGSFEGAGIGLAIAKRIVVRHGGRIWAEGRVDEGATIYFTLPARE